MKNFTRMAFSCAVAALLLSAANGYAQANDECSGAVILTPSATCNPTPGNTGPATVSPNATSDCDYSDQGDVWYKVTAASSDWLTIKVSNFASTDANLEDAYVSMSVFTGDCSSLTEVNCTDDGEYYDGSSYSDMSLTINNATPGTDYYIKVAKQVAYDQDYNDYNPSDLSFDICVQSQTPPPAPPNDECADAISITPAATCSPVTGDISGATTSANGTSDCEDGDMGDMWYTFTASSTNTIAVSIPNINSTDDNLEEASLTYTVFTGDCNDPVEYDCNESYYDYGETDNYGPVIINDAAPGTVYFVKVSKTYTADQDYNDYNPTNLNFDLCVKELVPPANDECSGAIAIGASYTGNNEGATQSMAPVECEGYQSESANDVWYKFTPTQAGTVQVSVSQNNVDIVAEAFEGSCGNLTSIACVDDDDYLSYSATANTLYYLRVYGYGGDAGDFDINISGVTLPLKLISFSGRTVGNINILNWQTAEEKNFSHFEIERSEDGMHYVYIGELKGSNTEAGGSYSFKDDKPMDGKNMYRLKLVDQDGKNDYSNVVVLENKTTNKFDMNAYPNPADDKLHIAISGLQGTNAKIVITDISGKTIISKNIYSNNEIFDLSNIAPGVYFLKYRDDLNTKAIKLTKK